MTKSLVCIAMFALCSAPALAEQRGQGRGNPGVSPQTIMDNADIRTSRERRERNGCARPGAPLQIEHATRLQESRSGYSDIH